MSHSNLILRPPNRDELPNLASLQNAANAKSHLHHLMAPGQFQDPKAYYEWTLLRQRTRFVTPFLRFIIAEDAQTNEILGLSLWSAQGESALRRRWESAGSIFDRAFWGMERALLDAEMKYNRYILGDKIIDYDFVNRFVCAAHEAGEAIPPCLHLWVLMTAPAAQGKGVGKALMDRGKTLARQEGLSLILESNLEAVGFYEKMGMKRIKDAGVEMGESVARLIIPCFAWEAVEREFLAEDGEGDGRWTWRDGKKQD